MGPCMEFKPWFKALKRLAKAQNLEYLIGDAEEEHMAAWREGRAPREALMSLYEDAGFPLEDPPM